MIPDAIYTDGGVIGPNPSRLGGTWCFLHVHQSTVVLRSSGVITPDDLDGHPVSNNDTETLAIVRALESVAADWQGVLHTDSMVAMRRILNPALLSKMPVFLRKRVGKLHSRTPRISLVAGHPTAEELKLGYALRNRYPVSEFNVLCDRECTRLAKLFREDQP